MGLRSPTALGADQQRVVEALALVVGTHPQAVGARWQILGLNLGVGVATTDILAAADHGVIGALQQQGGVLAAAVDLKGEAGHGFLEGEDMVGVGVGKARANGALMVAHGHVGEGKDSGSGARGGGGGGSAGKGDGGKVSCLGQGSGAEATERQKRKGCKPVSLMLAAHGYPPYAVTSRSRMIDGWGVRSPVWTEVKLSGDGLGGVEGLEVDDPLAEWPSGGGSHWELSGGKARVDGNSLVVSVY